MGYKVLLNRIVVLDLGKLVEACCLVGSDSPSRSHGVASRLAEGHEH
jgi:hypothetical protein